MVSALIKVLQLMICALKDTQMLEKRDEIRSTDFIQKLEEQVKSLRHDMLPEQIMN